LPLVAVAPHSLVHRCAMTYSAPEGAHASPAKLVRDGTGGAGAVTGAEAGGCGAGVPAGPPPAGAGLPRRYAAAENAAAPTASAAPSAAAAAPRALRRSRRDRMTSRPAGGPAAPTVHAMPRKSGSGTAIASPHRIVAEYASQCLTTAGQAC